MDLLKLVILLIVLTWRSNGHYGMVQAIQITYDHRGLLFDNQPKLLISGSIHYPRSTPQMWPDLIAKAKDGGLNVIQTYVFWDAHEPQQGIYNFEDNLDLVKFVKTVQNAGLYLSLRIGPYIDAEWNFGGFPMWLALQPGVKMRTYNSIFMNAMQSFTTKIVQMMKDEGLFAWQGGPIIMAQIENEFGSYPTNSLAYKYAMWAANMAVSLNIGVPWIMCKQPDAPDPVINTYNGGVNGATFQPNSPNKPKMWTEVYTGWFQNFGTPKPQRPVQNLAFEIARFFQSNGSFVNYYMYHGGTNFGRTAGGPFITTSYDYDAPIDEYGLIRQPKWGHLKELHNVLMSVEDVLMMGLTPNVISLGSNQEASVFSTGSDNCIAFLSNLDTKSAATVQFNGVSYTLPAQSVSILPDCKTVAFNTATVSVQTNANRMLPANFSSSRTPVNAEDSVTSALMSWDSYSEPIGAWGAMNFTSKCCVEQISTTQDNTDYLWYTTSFEASNGGQSTLEISAVGDAAHLFVNGQYIATVAGTRDSPLVQLAQSITLQTGTNEIAILSMTVGVQSGVRSDHIQKLGIQGAVTINNPDGGSISLSSQSWTYQVGLQGEYLQIYSEEGIQNVQWTTGASPAKNQPMTWYKTTFDSPTGEFPLALDLITMGKGQAWVNGRSIGRYWPSSNSPTKGCTQKCIASQVRCYSGCGKSSQRWYHIPIEWLKPTGNLLVLSEEIGGDPTGITIVQLSSSTVCSAISEHHLAPFSTMKSTTADAQFAQMTLKCHPGQAISSIEFASYGTPRGACSQLSLGLCHASSSKQVIEQACIGKATCSVQVNSEVFGIDPCPNRKKTLAAVATCSAASPLSQR